MGPGRLASLLTGHRRVWAKRAGVGLLIKLAATLALLAIAGSAHAAALRERPNIVLIQTDDQIVSDLRYMPHVRRLLIAGGTEFTNFFDSYALCCPARATLLTGQFAHNHKVVSNFRANGGGYYKFRSLPGRLNQRNSLGPWLHNAGYRTALVGKYLNEYGALDRRDVPPGWDEWAALLDNSTYDYFNYGLNHNGRVRIYGSRRYANEQMRLAHLGILDPPRSFSELLELFRKVFQPYDWFGSQRERNYTMDVTGGYAARFVSRATPSEQPFFLYYAPPGPHAEDTNHAQGLRPGAPDPDPRPPARYRHTFDQVPLPHPPSFNETDVSDKAANIRDLPLLSDEQIEEIEDNYHGRLGAVRAVDDQVARIVAALRRAGELDDTFIVFNSDNGYLQAEHRLRGSKFVPYENSIRVPTLIRGPGVLPGQKLDGIAINVDLAPTILDIAGVRPGRVEDGISLLSAARGEGRLPRRDVPLEALRPLFRFYTPITAFDVPYYGVRTERFKYIHWSFGERELYDLRQDPDELENLAAKPAYAELAEMLEAKAKRLRHCRGAGCR